MQTLEWEQRRHLAEIGELWGKLGPLLQARHQFTGGVAWKEIKGYTYLTRYRTDPVTHAKKFEYLGQRKPETERLYSDFLQQRAALDAEIEPLERRMEVAARVSKALRLGRMPTSGADALRAIWRAGLNEHLVVIDGINVCAYELQAGVFDYEWPIPADDIQLMSLAPDMDEVIDDLRRALLSADRGYRFDKKTSSFASSDGYLINVLSKRAVEERFTMHGGGNLEREAVDWSISLPPWTRMVIGVNGRPASASVLDPRAFLVLACCVSETNSAFVEQAEAVARMIPPAEMEPIPEQFAELSPILLEAFGDMGSPRM